MRKNIDILCAGELLVEFTNADFTKALDENNQFKSAPGGSSSTLCLNMARLGNQAMLAATVGTDDMGTALKKYVAKLGVDVSSISQVDEPTTLILNTRPATTSNFQIYRAADFALSIRQFPYGRFGEISLFHTTCFALSRRPSQNVLLEAAEKAVRAGVQVSLDANFSEKIWPDRREAQRIVSEYSRLRALVKISDADWVQLYGEPPSSPEAVLDHFLKTGAREVCYTLGAEGLWVGNDSERHFLPARTIKVKDTSRAGDAFWSGYLTARLDGKNLKECGTAGRRMAEMKLCHAGPLPDKIDRAVIYEDLE